YRLPLYTYSSAWLTSIALPMKTASDLLNASQTGVLTHWHASDSRLIPQTTITRSVHWKRSEEHTSELQSLTNLVCRLLLVKNTSDPHGRELCLRPDLTIPVSRAYLQSPSAGKVAAYCYLGVVFLHREGEATEILQAGIESF